MLVSGNHVLSAGQDRAVHMWDSISGDYVDSLKSHPGAITQLLLTGSSRIQLWVAMLDKSLKAWNIKPSASDRSDFPTSQPELILDDDQVVLQKTDLRKLSEYVDDLETQHRTVYQLLKETLKEQSEVVREIWSTLERLGFDVHSVGDDVKLESIRIKLLQHRQLLQFPESLQRLQLLLQVLDPV